MKRSSLALILLLSALLLSLVSAQTILWEHTWGGTDDDYFLGVSVDRFGNSYAVGYTYSFGAGDTDAFIAKFGSDGSLLWDRTWGGDDEDEAEGVAVDDSGNAYMTGYTYFGAGDTDAFIAKFYAGGSLAWDLTWGWIHDEEATDIALDKDGNIYIVGDTSSFGAGDMDAFIAKFDSSGGLIWDRIWGGSSDDWGYGVSVDEDGNVYIVGSTTSFGAGANDAFIAKFSSNGDLIWDRTWGTSSIEGAYGIAVDVHGNVYVTGNTQAYHLTRLEDVFIAKFSSDGNLIWDLVWGGSDPDYGEDIDVDDAGNLYVVGSTFSFGNKGFLLRLDSDGNLLRQVAWGGTGADHLVSVDVSGAFLCAAGDTISRSRTVRDIAGTTLSILATISDPAATPADPSASVGDPAATIRDPSATVDNVVNYDAAILQFKILLPVGGEITTPYSQKGWRQITLMIAIISLTLILTIIMIIRKHYVRS